MRGKEATLKSAAFAATADLRKRVGKARLNGKISGPEEEDLLTALGDLDGVFMRVHELDGGVTWRQ